MERMILFSDLLDCKAPAFSSISDEILPFQKAYWRKKLSLLQKHRSGFHNPSRKCMS
jgi:hypothetical protein